MKSEYNKLEAEIERLKTELEDLYGADNEIQEIVRKIETENERLHAEITRLKEALLWCLECK